MQANKNICEVQFEVGDFVYLKLQPYQQVSGFRHSLKLSARFYGPYEILEKIGPVVYRLCLLDGAQIHNIFHVSLLRKHLDTRPELLPNFPPVTHDSSPLPTPSKILEKRVVQKVCYHLYTEILVQWHGTESSDATWENYRRFSRLYLEFVLEDKDNFGRME